MILSKLLYLILST